MPYSNPVAVVAGSNSFSNPFFEMDRQPVSCYGSMVASTSDEQQPAHQTTNLNSLPGSSSRDYIEAPAFFYDVDHDLRDLKSALCGKSEELLADSGYQSVIGRSQHPLSISFVAFEEDETLDGEENDDDWDGFLTVGVDRVKIKDMSDILASRYAFLSGSRSNEGLSLVTFPDSRSQLSFEDYQLLITYLLQVPPLEESKGFIIIVDRRNDKWAAVRQLFMHISAFFPGQIRVVLLLKPEGVLQRALEVGYRSVAENCAFKVVVCESSLDLRRYLRAEQLTMDVGGLIKYNHLEWVQHRMDIERMKSSATVIAQSLSDFGRSLRETELPNDTETTARILQAQSQEKDAIKEDFRISVRKGLCLLRSVRQLESKPRHEQLSPTRLHNVTAIERMLVQLEETEKSFDTFWAKHEKRLLNCLQLRQFEEAFRKLQSSFARHMLYLEEHREVGDGANGAELLEQKHRQYSQTAMDDVSAARELRVAGEELCAANDIELSGSLLPKCDELERMAEALTGALDRRAQVLAMSRNMHTQILQANQWCKKGVEMLTTPSEVTSSLATSSGQAKEGLEKMDDFLNEGSRLQLDALSVSPSMNSLILLTTTETSTLLAQVAERIDDIRRMSVARRDALAKAADQKRPQVQVVTPEKKKKETLDDAIKPDVSSSPSPDGCCDLPSTSPQSPHSINIEAFVIGELLQTERSYVAELEQLVEFYVDPFESDKEQTNIAPAIRGRTELVFGNLRELLLFHSRFVLPDLEANQNSPSAICRTFLQHRHTFLSLYYSYCQNKTTSEAVRRDFADSSPFFAEAQRRAGHALPLGAYLLKPVQRVTKYQLLLRELERHCRPEVRPDVGSALSAMLDLLAQINAAIHQLHISGFNGDLRLLGALRLQSECDVFGFNRKKKAKWNRAQRRYVFLFDGGVLFCKKRQPPSGQAAPLDPEYYEHKMCIPSSSLGFLASSRSGPSRFEVWDEARSEGFAVEPCEPAHFDRWTHKLGSRLTELDARELERQRPKSWASTVSSDSNCSSSTRTSDDSAMDTNGNTQTAMFGSPSLSPLSSPLHQLKAELDHVVPQAVVSDAMDAAMLQQELVEDV